MADQHNSNIPAVGNQIANDIPDIKENLEFHKDAFQRIFETWSDSDNSSQKIDTAVGFNDGTYNYEFPTNGVGAHSVIMLGTSDTIVWFYLNTAPPGWKALSTGADSVLAVSGGSDDYNVNGGNPDSSATWTISGINQSGHTHSMPSHNHKVYDYQSAADSHVYNSGGSLTDITANTVGQSAQNRYHIAPTDVESDQDSQSVQDFWTSNSSDTTGSTDPSITQNGGWRPKASVGKLFQLDTA